MDRNSSFRRRERRRPRLASLMLALVIAACVPAVWARPASAGAGVAPGPVEADAGVRRDGLSLDEAIDRAQKRFRARVVRAEQTQSGGRVVYVLRLLSDENGRVFTVRVDAESGAMQ